MSVIPLPGSSGPAASLAEPFELLAGCHDRVRRTLDLLGRLCAHLQQHGADADARSAAQDVQRYFSIAAPLHHADEERHIVPVLLASDEPELQAAGRQMLADHRAIESCWAELSPLLQQIISGHPLIQGVLDGASHRFQALHAPHLVLEDQLAFVAARALIGPTGQRDMSLDMARRRGVRLDGMH